MTSCLSGASTIIRVTTNATVFSGQSLAGRTMCIQNSIIDIDPSTTVDASTCFEANGNNGVSVTVGGITFDYINNDNTLGQLNTALAGLSSGSTIGAVATALPVELKSFSAFVSDKKSNQIDWITSSEAENDYFLLEHSTDGINFRYLTKVNSYGNSQVEQRYHFTHETGIPGDHIYRLWQFDLDGSYANLGLTSIKREGLSGAYLYPNPVAAGQSIKLIGEDLDLQEASCILYNIMGQQWILEQHDGRFVLPAKLVGGMYIIRFSDGTYQSSLPIQVR